MAPACSLPSPPTQVDVGGAPAPLLNHISKRQPLAVAYLREYLSVSGGAAVNMPTTASPHKAQTSPIP